MRKDFHKRLFFLLIALLLVGCAKSSPTKLRTSQGTDIKKECRGIKTAGELTSTEFEQLIKCLNVNRALDPIIPLLMGDQKAIERSTRLYNSFFGESLKLSDRFKTRFQRLVTSFDNFTLETKTTLRALKNDVREGFVNFLAFFGNEDAKAEVIQKRIIQTLAAAFNAPGLEETLSGFFNDLSVEQKYAILEKIGTSAGNMPHFLDKWGAYRTWWKGYAGSEDDRIIREPKLSPDVALSQILKSGFLQNVHAALGRLSQDELEFLQKLLSYELNPKYRSLTFVRGDLHERWITDPEYFDHPDPDDPEADFKKDIEKFEKQYPRSNIATLVNLLVALDRPLRGNELKDDVLFNMMSLFIELYRIWLVSIDIPENIQKPEPINYDNQRFGPDSEVAEMATQTIQLLYTTRKMLADLKTTDSIVEDTKKNIIGSPPIPKEISTSDPLFLVSLKQNDPERFKITVEEILSVYNYYKESPENQKPLIAQTKMALVYMETWKGEKLKQLFSEEVNTILTESGFSEDELYNAVITLRKLIPWLEKIEVNVEKQIAYMTEKQSWLENHSLFEIVVALDGAPSVTRSLLSMLGRVDHAILKKNLMPAISEFIVPMFRDHLALLNRLFIGGNFEEAQSYLGEFLGQMRDLDPDSFSDSLLFFIVSMLESYQSAHDYIIRDVMYVDGSAVINPWAKLPPEKRLSALVSLAAPILGIVEKTGTGDAVVDLLYSLRTARFHIRTSSPDNESKEFINFWADNFKNIPDSLGIFLSLKQGTINSLSAAMQYLTAHLATPATELLDYISVRSDDPTQNILSNIVRDDLSKSLAILYSDEEIIHSIALQENTPIELSLIIELFKQQEALVDIAAVCNNKETLYPALDFLEGYVKNSGGLYRTLEILNRLTANGVK